MTGIRKWGGSRDRAWVQAVLSKYGRVCLLNLAGCTVVATTADHIIPRSQRPDLDRLVDNGRPSCASCNRKRSTRPLARPDRVRVAGFFESAPTAGTDLQ